MHTCAPPVRALDSQLSRPLYPQAHREQCNPGGRNQPAYRNKMRMTHHVHILSINGESYRLTQSARKLAAMVVGDQFAVEAVGRNRRNSHPVVSDQFSGRRHAKGVRSGPFASPPHSPAFIPSCWPGFSPPLADDWHCSRESQARPPEPRP
jgi:hypothetical protein